MIANVQHWTELIGKKLSGNIREDEERILNAWIARDPEHREYYESVARVWETTGRISGKENSPEMDWSEIESEITSGGKTVTLPKLNPQETARIRQIGLRVAGIAAVFLLGFILVFQLIRQEPLEPVIIAEAASQVEEITLPDGSIVTLREGSKLSYHPDFTDRAVALEGEAFFAVTHDPEHPFTVAAGKGSIRVLGTQFNVVANAESPVELYVVEGQVAFAPEQTKYDAKIFSKGQAGLLENQQVIRTAPPGPNVSSWISGQLVFDHETLDHVIRDISRHFEVELSVADSALYACEFKADFHDATLDDVLETLSFGLNLQIDTVDSTYLISGEPCSIKEKN